MRPLLEDIFGDGPWYAALRLTVLAFGSVLSAATFSGGCSGAKTEASAVADDAACSPRADAMFAARLAATCKGKPLSECPGADEIGDRYEAEADAECGQ